MQVVPDKDIVSQFKHHRDQFNQFNKYDKLSDSDKSHLSVRNHHEKEMNRHFLAMTDKEKSANWYSPTNETVSDDNSRMEAYLKQISYDIEKSK